MFGTKKKKTLFLLQAKEIAGLRMFKIVGAIHFANQENLRSFLIKKTDLDPKTLAKAAQNKSEEERQKEVSSLSYVVVFCVYSRIHPNYLDWPVHTHVE